MSGSGVRIGVPSSNDDTRLLLRSSKALWAIAARSVDSAIQEAASEQGLSSRCSKYGVSRKMKNQQRRRSQRRALHSFVFRKVCAHHALRTPARLIRLYRLNRNGAS